MYTHRTATRPKRALLYTRVSTDEQADRGYSLRDQESRLRSHCDRHGIEVVDHYQDDQSAKTFDRPAFKKLLTFVRANRGAVDTLFIVKWDRFSRDSTGALGMIRTLEELGVEVQAVEQPIDWSIPEQRMMLAIYVTAPEVENRRRSLATKSGMLQAMREGRWCSKPPIGYKRARDERDRAFIVPNDAADFVRRAFEMAANLDVPLEEIRRRLAREGFKCSKPQFTLLVRNPVYMGKILVPAWRDEPEELVEGLHEALVSEATFNKVQQRFAVHRTSTKSGGRPYKLRPEIVLRGHLLCASCGELLTGSGSKGNGGRYWYYHCHHCGQERFRAEAANVSVEHYLNDLTIGPEVAALYEDVVDDLSRGEKDARSRQTARLRQEIKAIDEKLLRATDLLIEGNLDRESYQRYKQKYQDDLLRLRVELETAGEYEEGFADQLRFAVGLLANLGTVYQAADYRVKHALLGSIFPRKLVFREGDFRTSPKSEVIALLSGNTQKMRDARPPKRTSVLSGCPA